MSTINTSNPLAGAPAATGSSPSPASAPSRFSDMSTEDFIRIIFTELSNQDPFKPNDANALLEQLNSIRSIESDLKLTEQLQSLVTENQLGAASGMIGKFIGGMTDDHIRVAGYVVSVIRQGDDITLELDNGWLVPFTSVETVIDPSTLPEQPAHTTPGGNNTGQSGNGGSTNGTNSNGTNSSDTNH